jgi:hypothetical protein
LPEIVAHCAVFGCYRILAYSFFMVRNGHYEKSLRSCSGGPITENCERYFRGGHWIELLQKFHIEILDLIFYIGQELCSGTAIEGPVVVCE